MVQGVSRQDDEALEPESVRRFANCLVDAQLPRTQPQFLIMAMKLSALSK